MKTPPAPSNGPFISPSAFADRVTAASPAPVGEAGPPAFSPNVPPAAPAPVGSSYASKLIGGISPYNPPAPLFDPLFGNNDPSELANPNHPLDVNLDRDNLLALPSKSTLLKWATRAALKGDLSYSTRLLRQFYDDYIVGRH